MRLIKRGTRVEVSLTVLVHKECTREELDSWLQFEFGYTGYLPAGNPLVDREACVTEFSLLEVSENVDDDDLKELEENER